MEELEITLPCGFVTLYKNIQNKTGNIECMLCKNHQINLTECLNIPKNRLVLKQKQYELELNGYFKYQNTLNECLRDPDYYVDKSLEDIKIKLELRREDLIEVLTKQVNDHFLDLINTLDSEHLTKLNKFKQDVSNIDELQIESHSIDDSLDFETKINLIETNLRNLNIKNKSINICIKNLNDTKTFEFVDGHYNLNMEHVFGKLKKKDQTEIDDDDEIKKLKLLFSSSSSLQDYKLVNSLNGHSNAVFDICLFNENKLLSASWDGSIKLWDIKIGSCIGTFSKHTDWVMCVCELNEGFFASGSMDKIIRIWDTKTGKCIQKLTGHYGAVVSLRLLKNGCLISGSSDKTILKWNYKANNLLGCYSGHDDLVRCFEETEDGKVISGSWDQTIRVWDQNLKNSKVLKGHKHYVICIKLINQRLLASGSGDNTIKIWDIYSTDCLVTFDGHTNAVSSLKLIKEGVLVSGSWDQTIKFWDIHKKQCIDTIHAHENSIYRLECDKNGLLISASRDNSIKIWTNKVL